MKQNPPYAAVKTRVNVVLKRAKQNPLIPMTRVVDTWIICRLVYFDTVMIQQMAVINKLRHEVNLSAIYCLCLDEKAMMAAVT